MATATRSGLISSFTIGGNGELRNNLIVIELKKHEDREDWVKANEYTRPPRGPRKFQYQFGLALTLMPLGYRWYQAGKLLELSAS